MVQSHSQWDILQLKHLIAGTTGNSTAKRTKCDWSQGSTAYNSKVKVQRQGLERFPHMLATATCSPHSILLPDGSFRFIKVLEEGVGKSRKGEREGSVSKDPADIKGLMKPLGTPTFSL